jgi:hypothetical protein
VNRTFDFYEYAGFIIPGAVVVMAVVWLFPESRALFSKEGVTLGELGLFVIIAYAAGQLVQAIGNFLEWLWWKPWGGMPTGRVLTGKLLTPEQQQRLIEALRPALGGADPSKIPEAQRRAIVREVYAEVLGAGKAAGDLRQTCIKVCEAVGRMWRGIQSFRGWGKKFGTV